MKIKFDDLELNLVNIYAPNNDMEKRTFFENLKSWLSDDIDKIIFGILIDGRRYECNDATQKFTLVSFMHLPSYIDDEEIKQKFENVAVELLSPIKRRFYKGTNVAGGTRYARVKLLSTLKSLPYTSKFGNECHRVIHDNQLKVCSLCYSDEHLFKD